MVSSLDLRNEQGLWYSMTDTSLHVYCLYSANAQVDASVKWTGLKNWSVTVKL